jgi:hypothetical protein
MSKNKNTITVAGRTFRLHYAGFRGEERITAWDTRRDKVYDQTRASSRAHAKGNHAKPRESYTLLREYFETNGSGATLKELFQNHIAEAAQKMQQRAEELAVDNPQENGDQIAP